MALRHSIVCAGVALGVFVRAGSPGPTVPSPVPAASVDPIFAAYDRTDSPGCAVGVFRDGRIELARGYGIANLELGVALSPQSVLDIGSTAKQFTALAVLLLKRDGKLSLDDDIRKFVPEIPDYGARVAIRNLLNHTSGLRDYLELMDLAGIRDEDLTTEQDALDVLARQKALNFAPGSDHLYSNSGYFLLSVIVRRASGKSLRDFARERIFDPLGMTHTQFNDDHTRILPNRATGYSSRPGGGFGIDMSDFEQNGDGGLVTSIEDLFRWNENFFHPSVGDAKLLDEMQTPGRLTTGKALTYAFGLSVGTERGLKTVSHGGAWVGYRAQLLRFPDQHFAVACLCNLSSANPSALARKVAEVYLDHRMEKADGAAKSPASPAAPIPAADLQRLAGAYRDKNGAVWFLTVGRDRLVADAHGHRVAFDAVSADRFLSRDGSLDLRVLRSSDGSRPSLEAKSADEDAQILRPIAAWAPEASTMPDFAGSYVSNEVDGTFRFEIAHGSLVLRHRTISPEPWKPTVPDTFTSEGMDVEFLRDSAGAVNGFRLDLGRVRGLAFRKAAPK